MYSIISIDGGGMKGIVPCSILNYLENKIQDIGDDDSIRLADCVDFFVGTSTGGIVSLGLTSADTHGKAKYSVKQLLDFYRLSGPEIFDVNLWRKLSTGFGLRDSKYPDAALKETMNQYFGEQKLSDSIVPTLVTAYDLSSQKPLYFSSYRAQHSDHDNYLTRDVALATASAPTFFPLAEIESFGGDQRLCVDGVMLAYNPALIAYAEFRRLLHGTRAANMNLISLSTGYCPLDIDSEEAKQWGSIEWGSNFSNIIVQGHQQNVHHQLTQVFADTPHNYTRIDPPLLDSVQDSLDCATADNISVLLDSSHQYIERNKALLDTIAMRLHAEAFHPEARVFYKGLGIEVQPIWQQHYPSTACAVIDIDHYTNLIEFLDEASLKFSERIAYESYGVELSYSQVKRYSEQIAFWLQSQALMRGDRVGIMLPNILSYPIIFQASLKAGMIAVNINPHSSSDELDHIIEDSGCKVIFIWENVANRLQQAKNVSSIHSIIICKLTDYFPPVKTAYHHFVGMNAPHYRFNKFINLPKIIAQSKDKYPFGVPITAEDTAFIQYTRGTMGEAKGAMITQRNMLANVLQMKQFTHPQLCDSSTQKSILTALPLSHPFALTVNTILGYSMGMVNSLIADSSNTSAILDSVKRRPLHCITGNNELYEAILANASAADVDWSQLIVALSSGMASLESTAKQWFEMTQTQLIEVYGLSEASPCVTANNYENTEFANNVGIPLPATEIMIADELGKPLAIGSEGEICVKGPQVMKGYWGQSHNFDSEIARHRWLRTGDLGRLDECGRLTVVGRLQLV